MITRVPVSAAERTAGKLSPGHLAAALAALRADGIVALGDAIDPRVIDGLREVPPPLSKSSAFFTLLSESTDPDLSS